MRLTLVLPAICLVCACVPAGPADAQPLAQDLGRLTLEELLNVEVTTVSRTAGPRTLTPAAVHVITQEDIRRSGATTLPEALRLAPGVHVARIDANRWAIGTRGFTDRLARAMLVMIDGRAVYSPLFAGTYWEVQDYLLEDVERIEVVRGPGGTLWGARLVLPVTFANGLHGNSHGIEVDADIRFWDWWRWTASYSLLRVQLTEDDDSDDVSQERFGEGSSPTHQLRLQSSADLPGNLELDWLFRYVSDLPGQTVPAYAASDVRLGWLVSSRLELALVGRISTRRGTSSSPAARSVTWRCSAACSARSPGPGDLALRDDRARRLTARWRRVRRRGCRAASRGRRAAGWRRA